MSPGRRCSRPGGTQSCLGTVAAAVDDVAGGGAGGAGGGGKEGCGTTGASGCHQMWARTYRWRSWDSRPCCRREREFQRRPPRGLERLPRGMRQ
jgi:hypothetical protein